MSHYVVSSVSDPGPEVREKYTERKGKSVSPARGHDRPWGCTSKHRDQPLFNQSFQIPASPFPVSTISDTCTVLLSPLPFFWPSIFPASRQFYAYSNNFNFQACFSYLYSSAKQGVGTLWSLTTARTCMSIISPSK